MAQSKAADGDAQALDPEADVARFAAEYDFGFDPFQVQACQALAAGRSVLVAAPTGSGKTVAGEYAVDLALRSGRKCFYTTPIKALSNQKYRELATRYGEERVGLLTGDNSVNGEADVVVMTTEVLRNMLYAGSSTIDRLGYVVMDEVHYLADRSRGAVWEEVLIHLPGSVTVASLSATVSNAEEFGQWLATVRGRTEIIVEEHRPVPLWQHVMANNKIYDLYIDDAHRKVNPQLLRLARDEQQALVRGRDRRGRARRPTQGARRNARGRSRFTPMRSAVIRRLERDDLLPAITFIFSRAGCDQAVDQCLADGLRLNTAVEATQIRHIVDERLMMLPAADLEALGAARWSQALQRGIAAHHAGLLPVFKETVEHLFQRGLLKAVFATETLALGINMPARSVVLERLSKWNGEQHVPLTPGEYTQLTGRAGRRGIDVEGHAVVTWACDLDPQALAGLAATRTYPLRSSFRPSYNMAVNLISQYGRPKARALLETSFAQFQADAAVVGLVSEIRRNEQALAGYQESVHCHLGDFAHYFTMRSRLTDLERGSDRRVGNQDRALAGESLLSLRPGDIVMVPTRRRAGPAVVLDPGIPGTSPGPAQARPTVLTMDRRVQTLSAADFPHAVAPVGHIHVPKHFSARSAGDRKQLAALLREASADIPPDAGRPKRKKSESEEIEQLRRDLRQHPCHGCHDREQHARWAERAARLERATAKLRARVENRTGSIARQFDQVCEVLLQTGYLHSDTSAHDELGITGQGRKLASLYNENDLVAAECLRRGIWDQLQPAELAAAVSALVYESRSPEGEERPARLPGGETSAALAGMQVVAGELQEVEREHKLSFVRPLDAGFAWPIYRWANGASLETVLWEAELTPGDFVRWCKQVVDLLGQLQHAAAGTTIAGRADRAADAIVRSVVAYTGMDE